MKYTRADTAGRFRVWLYKAGETERILIHDRKTEGGFAEMKVIVG
jgi:predicted Rdx family selenoprotein